LKSPCGTAKKVAISPPEALLQSRQWQLAIKSGSVSNPNFTAPQAHCAVYFLVMPTPSLSKSGYPPFVPQRTRGDWLKEVKVDVSRPSAHKLRRGKTDRSRAREGPRAGPPQGR